jgi:four helix bundle protein
LWPNDAKGLCQISAISFGSVQEVEYLSFLARELDYMKQEEYESINKNVNEVKAMLLSLLKKVRTE